MSLDNHDDRHRVWVARLNEDLVRQLVAAAPEGLSGIDVLIRLTDDEVSVAMRPGPDQRWIGWGVPVEAECAECAARAGR